MPERRGALFYARDAFFMAQQDAFDMVESLFDAVQSPVDRFQLLEQRPGDYGVQTAEKRCGCGDYGRDCLPELRIIHWFSPAG
jgi:hypothetical protein